MLTALTFLDTKQICAEIERYSFYKKKEFSKNLYFKYALYHNITLDCKKASSTYIRLLLLL